MTKEDLSANNGQGRCGHCRTQAQCISAQHCVKEDLSGGWVDGDGVVHTLEEWVPASAIPSPYKGDERLDERTPGCVRLGKVHTAPDCPAHDTRCTAEACAWLTGEAKGPRGLPERDTFPALGELPVRENAHAKNCPAHDYRCTPEKCEWQDERFWLTPKAHEELDAALLADDPLHQQMLPPAVPEVTSSAFKIGVLVGMLVASGVWYALPRLVEVFQ